MIDEASQERKAILNPAQDPVGAVKGIVGQLETMVSEYGKLAQQNIEMQKAMGQALMALRNNEPGEAKFILARHILFNT